MPLMVGRARRRRVVALALLLVSLILVPAAAAGPDVRVSAGTTTADAFVGGALGLDFRAGVLRAAWADNSAALAGNPDRPNLDIGFAADGGENVNVTRLAGSESGAALAVDPTNANNLVVAANAGVENFTPSTVRAFSRDGGATWSVVTGLPGNFGGFPPAVAFDAFGNCFLALVSDPSFGSPRLALYLSTDGGATFSPVPLPDPAGMLQTEVSLAAGFGSVWLAFQSHDGRIGMRTLAAPVSGRGTVGAFTGQAIVGGSVDARDPDLALGPGGAAIVAFHEDLFGATPSVSVAVDGDGLGAGGFGPPRTVVNVPGYPHLPRPQIAVGPGARTVLVFQDRPDAAGSEEIPLVFSEDFGSTWSPATVVNDPVAAARRQAPQVAVDLGSGAVAVAWFDFRSAAIEVWSDRFGTLVRPPEPRAPVDLLATTVSRTQIDLRWTDTSGDETGFQVERGGANPFEPPTIVATLGPNATSYSDTGLAEDTGYGYRVRAVNAAGVSRWTNGASATTLDTPPTAPQNLVATGITFQRIDLRWEPSDDPDGYEIQRSLDGTSWISLGRRASTATEAMIFGLEPDRIHFFRVRAFNSGGDSPFSNVASARTSPSPPNGSPTGLSATAVSRSEIALRWTDTSSNESRFEIERSSGGAFKVVATAPENASSFTDRRLKAGTSYTYRVRACNPQGCSFPSNTATATTLTR